MSQVFWWVLCNAKMMEMSTFLPGLMLWQASLHRVSETKVTQHGEASWQGSGGVERADQPLVSSQQQRKGV